MYECVCSLRVSEERYGAKLLQIQGTVHDDLGAQSRSGWSFQGPPANLLIHFCYRFLIAYEILGVLRQI